MTKATDLAARLQQRIQREGRLSFKEFMRVSLYDPVDGYYMRPGVPHADFFTSVTRHPVLFGAMLGRHLDDVWEALRRPSPFVVVELGSGDGALAAQIAHVAPTHRWGQDLVYFGIEIASPRRLVASQRVPTAKFCESLDEAPHFEAMAVLSNEFFDAQPASLGRRDGNDWVEEQVAFADGHLTLMDVPANEVLRAYAASYGQAILDGGRFEMRDDINDIYSQMSAAAKRCVITSIDFGGWASEVHGPRLHAGTLLAYRQHRASDDVLSDPGHCDLATHVNFTELVDSGRRYGLHEARSGAQAEFLAALGVGEYLANLQRQAAVTLHEYVQARAAVFQIVSPTDLGRFRVLVQAREADLSLMRGLDEAVNE